MNPHIVSTGSFIPSRCVLNREFEAILDTNEAWITSRTGIKSRYFTDQDVTELATRAAVSALEGLDYESVDALLVATYTTSSIMPSCANQVKANLNIKRSIPSFDINAACTGFLYALEVARTMLLLPQYQRILVIGADQNAKYLDFKDRSTAILFGDGAGAIVIDATDEETSWYTRVHSETDLGDALTVAVPFKHANPFVGTADDRTPVFMMKGGDVFRFALTKGVELIADAFETLKLNKDDIKYIVMHQANYRILQNICKRMDMSMEQFPSNVGEYGNTSAASIPILLDELNKKNKLKRGDRLMLVAFGGGLTYGIASFKW